ncbi:MAG: DUF134 domain-containing protein [Candidatus Omnitrophota bacterium]|nr:DUF134 domain-containing protein [Candidatus Omnitrophota bacterium]
MGQGRPKKVRYIQNMPQVLQFSPRGKPGRPEEVGLSIDEFEALKLSDHQGFSQAQGAQAMKLSRPSFGRLVRGARRKVADALANGKIIKIYPGDAQVGVRKVDFRLDSFQEDLAKFNAQTKKVLRAAKSASAARRAQTPAGATPKDMF